MKWPVVVAFALVSFPSLLVAQRNTESELRSQDEAGQTQLIQLTGKVVGEDGSAPSGKVTVTLECGHEERGHALANEKGAFSLPVTLIPDNSPASDSHRAGTVQAGTWGDCFVFGDASGFRSERIGLFGKARNFSVDVGVIALHSVSQQRPAATISVTTLAAPENAKRAFVKGEEQEKKGKWAAAAEYFKKAINAYPRFAIAWLELGRSQMRQNSIAEAQQSFHQAVTQDSHCMEGYAALAYLATQQKQWNELADATDHMVQLSPDSSSRYWFLNAAANFNLGRVQQAETSAARGLRMDTAHQVPELEYLYGVIQGKEGHYVSAVEHLRIYLRLAPQAPDVPAAQNKLDDYEKLAQASNLVTPVAASEQ